VSWAALKVVTLLHGVELLTACSTAGLPSVNVTSQTNYTFAVDSVVSNSVIVSWLKNFMMMLNETNSRCENTNTILSVFECDFSSSSFLWLIFYHAAWLNGRLPGKLEVATYCGSLENYWMQIIAELFFLTPKQETFMEPISSSMYANSWCYRHCFIYVGSPLPVSHDARLILVFYFVFSYGHRNAYWRLAHGYCFKLTKIYCL